MSDTTAYLTSDNALNCRQRKVVFEDALEFEPNPRPNWPYQNDGECWSWAEDFANARLNALASGSLQCAEVAAQQEQGNCRGIASIPETTAYQWSDNARHCRRHVLLFSGPWPSPGVDMVWSSPDANSPEQGDAECWRTWEKVEDRVDGYMSTACEISVWDDTGQIDYWAYGTWDDYGAQNCEACAAPFPTVPKRPFIQRIWRTVCALFKGAQETARCVDE